MLNDIIKYKKGPFSSTSAMFDGAHLCGGHYVLGPNERTQDNSK